MAALIKLLAALALLGASLGRRQLEQSRPAGRIFGQTGPANGSGARPATRPIASAGGNKWLRRAWRSAARAAHLERLQILAAIERCDVCSGRCSHWRLSDLRVERATGCHCCCRCCGGCCWLADRLACWLAAGRAFGRALIYGSHSSRRAATHFRAQLECCHLGAGVRLHAAQHINTHGELGAAGWLMRTSENEIIRMSI
jgi:hypothetical protein